MNRQGRSQDFSKGGGGGSFLPPVVGCLLKTWLTKGEGHGHPRTPLLTGQGDIKKVINTGGHRACFQATMLTNTVI